ncbi:MAG: DUF928 domain-containing protein [Calothrix sp. MO_192.B10]|nr:DUF928 domain-containing protein [Calothrix sp. MO_192.B10]
MNKIFKTRSVIAICLTSLLSISFSLSHQVTANSGEKSREGLPGRRYGGGSRGCNEDMNGRLTALTPENNLVLTKSKSANFMFYLPLTSKPTMVELVLQDKNNNIVYEKIFTTTSTGGVINVSVPDSVAPLAMNKMYRWHFSVICDPTNRAHDIGVDGWIKRVEADNLWQDKLVNLAQKRYNKLNDSQLAASWKELLKSEKLDAIAQKPLLKLKIKQDQKVSVK